MEDGWFRGDLLGQLLVLEDFGPGAKSADEYWHHETESLESLLAYWETVEAGTLRHWPELMQTAASRRSMIEPRPFRRTR